MGVSAPTDPGGRPAQVQRSGRELHQSAGQGHGTTDRKGLPRPGAAAVMAAILVLVYLHCRDTRGKL